jgi:hypothetical protein
MLPMDQATRVRPDRVPVLAQCICTSTTTSVSRCPARYGHVARSVLKGLARRRRYAARCRTQRIVATLMSRARMVSPAASTVCMIQ